MSSLFLRIYFSTLAFLIIAFLTISYFANNFYPINALISNSDNIQKEVNQYLKNKPIKEWQDAIHVFDTFAYDTNVELIGKNELSESEINRLAASKNGVIKGDNRINNISIIYTLPNTQQTFLRIKEGNDDDMNFYDWLDIFLPLLLIFSTLAFGLFLLIRKLTQPIQYLKKVALELGQGNLEVRAKKGLPSPLNKLAEGFNSMAVQLDETIQEQQILIGAIPHELRSPLGRIRFALDMSRDKQSMHELRKHIEMIDGYVDDMQTTVDEILELNRLQNKQNIIKAPIDLCEIIQSAYIYLQPNATHINFSVDCKISKAPQGNSSLLKHAIQNLLENAMRYANTEIKIKVWQENEQTIIQIDDDGKGIATTKLTEVFIPFATTDSSRNRSTGGIGLGLALVKIIMKKHAGNAWASKNNLGGARFTLSWKS